MRAWNRLIKMSVGLVMMAAAVAQAERLKDISDVSGVRENKLIGYGLVVGLSGTGDSGDENTTQTLRNMISRFGMQVPQGVELSTDNVAAVSVHAELPPFAKPGQDIDVTVSSIGSAESLRGGSLLMTPLKGADGRIYAVAQGNVVVSGFGAEGADGSQLQVNVPRAGRIANGATVERKVPNPFDNSDHITFNLNRSDFTTAKRVVDVINERLGPGVAQAQDATSIRVSAPEDPSQKVTYLSVLENLQVEPGEEEAKVIVNSRTGTIVIGQNVKVEPAAVTHGSLTVTIEESLGISQPNPLAEGETEQVPDTEIQADQENNPMFAFKPGDSLDEIVTAVNEVGAAPGDLIAILEALKKAGAIQAELIVI